MNTAIIQKHSEMIQRMREQGLVTETKRPSFLKDRKRAVANIEQHSLIPSAIWKYNEQHLKNDLVEWKSYTVKSDKELKELGCLVNRKQSKNQSNGLKTKQNSGPKKIISPPIPLDVEQFYLDRCLDRVPRGIYSKHFFPEYYTPVSTVENNPQEYTYTPQFEGRPIASTSSAPVFNTDGTEMNRIQRVYYATGRVLRKTATYAGNTAYYTIHPLEALQDGCRLITKAPNPPSFSTHLQNSIDTLYGSTLGNVVQAEEAIFDAMAELTQRLLGLKTPNQLYCRDCLKEAFSGVWYGTPFRVVYANTKAHSHDGYTKQVSPVTLNLLYSVLRFLATGEWSLGHFDRHTIPGKTFGHIHDLNAWRKRNRNPEFEGDDEEQLTIVDAFKSLCGVKMPQSHFKKTAQLARDKNALMAWCTSWWRLVMSAILIFTKMLRWTMRITPKHVIAFVKDVDETVPIVTKLGEDYQVAASKLQTCHNLRSKLVSLYTSGIKILRNLESVDSRSSTANMVRQRVNLVRTTLDNNVACYAAAANKLTPYVIYLKGDPGTGKTALSRHLFSDIFAVLGKPTYQPERDSYTYNPVSSFHEGYTGQPVCLMEDVFQCQDKTMLINELMHIIRSADTSAYMLNMAFGGKGLVYFASDWMFMTSNIDPFSHENSISSAIKTKQAFHRRLNVVISVTRDTGADTPGFDKEGYTFNVYEKMEKPVEDNTQRVNNTPIASKQLTYYELVKFLASEFVKHRKNDLQRLRITSDQTKLAEIRQSLGPIEFEGKKNAFKKQPTVKRVLTSSQKSYPMTDTTVSEENTVVTNSPRSLSSLPRVRAEIFCPLPDSDESEDEEIPVATTFECPHSPPAYTENETPELEEIPLASTSQRPLSPIEFTETVTQPLENEQEGAVESSCTTTAPVLKETLKERKVKFSMPCQDIRYMDQHCVGQRRNYKSFDKEQIAEEEQVAYSTAVLKEECLAISQRVKQLTTKPKPLSTEYNPVRVFDSEETRAANNEKYAAFIGASNPQVDFDTFDHQVDTILSNPFAQSIDHDPVHVLNLNETAEERKKRFAALSISSDYSSDPKASGSWERKHTSSELKPEDTSADTDEDIADMRDLADDLEKLEEFPTDEKKISWLREKLNNLYDAVSDALHSAEQRTKSWYQSIKDKVIGAVKNQIIEDAKKMFCEQGKKVLVAIGALIAILASLAGIVTLAVKCKKFFSSVLPTKKPDTQYEGGAEPMYDESGKRTWPQQRVHMRGPQFSARNPRMEGVPNENFALRLMKNIIVAKGVYKVKGIAVKSHIFMLPEHVIDYSKPLCENEISLVLPNKSNTIQVRFKDIGYEHLPNEHILILDCRHHPAFKTVSFYTDITKLFVPSRLVESVYEGAIMGFRVVQSTMMTIFLTLTGLKPREPPIVFGNSKYVVYNSWQYNAGTIEGDCGLPIVTSINGNVYIVGTHAARHPQGPLPCFGGMITYEWLTDALSHMDATERVVNVEGLLDPSPILQEAVTVVPDSSIELLGKLTTSEYHLPRVTKLRPTLFFAEKYSRKEPALLRGVLPNGFTVLESAILRGNIPNVVVSKPHFRSGYKAVLKNVSDFAGLKRLLEWEEVLFGIEGEACITSFDSKAGLGHPWCQTYKREDFFSVERKTINPFFANILEKTEDSLRFGASFDIVVLDYLKDELLPHQKLVDGKTRMFSVLPIEINALLKRYFGGFVGATTFHHGIGMVKVGQSTLPADILRLVDYLRIGDSNMKFLCGDISNSDRVIPFGVFMLLVDIVNEWYDDSLKRERIKLAQALFAPIHLAGKHMYRTTRGMPSGSYLTATFNSLAYALMLCEAIPDHLLPYCAIATYGDDHVISLSKSLRFGMHDLKKWFAGFGITYTSPDKSKDLVDSYPWNEVEFLKRKFVQKRNRWFFPLNKESIETSMCWYRETAETNNWTSKTLHNSVMEMIDHETFSHGRKYFEEIRKYCKDSFPALEFTKCFDDLMLENVVGISEAIEYNISSTFVVDFDDLHEATFVGEDVPLRNHERDSSTFFEGIMDVTDVHATTLGEQDPEQRLCWLTDVDSLQPGTVVGTPTVSATPLDTWFNWPAGYANELTRLYPVDEIELSSETPTRFPLARYSLGAGLMGQAFNRSRLSKCQWFRSGVEVQIRVIATPFHYGGLLACIRPAFYSSQALLEYKQAGAFVDKGIFYQSIHGPYDSIHNASQIPHEKISVTGDTTVVLKAAWPFPNNYLKPTDITPGTAAAGLFPVDPWVLDIYALTPTYPTEMDQPHVTVQARFVNPELYGYVGANIEWDKIPTYPFEIKMPGVSNPTFDMGDVILKKVKKTENPSFEGDSDVPEGVVLEERAVEAEVMEEPSFWDSAVGFVRGVVDVGKAIVTIFSGFGSLLAFFGLSRPRDPANVKPVIVRPYNMATAVDLETAPKLAYDANDQMVRIDDDTTVLLEDLSEIPTFLKWDQFQNKGDKTDLILSLGDHIRLAYTSTSPNISYGPAVVQNRLYNVMTPAGYIASRFQLARSACELSIHVYASAMASVRLQLMVSPVAFVDKPTADFRAGVSSIQFEAKGDLVKKISLPYFWGSMMGDYTVLGKIIPRWYVSLMAISDVVTPETTETRRIMVAMFVKYPGLTVTAGGPRWAGNAAYVPTIIGSCMDGEVGLKRKKAIQSTSDDDFVRPSFEGERTLPRLGSPSDTDTAKHLATDIPRSIYHLLKRYYYVGKMEANKQYVVTAMGPTSSVSDPGGSKWASVEDDTFKTTLGLVGFDTAQFILGLYKYYRGGVKIGKVSTSLGAANVGFAQQGAFLGDIEDSYLHYLRYGGFGAMGDAMATPLEFPFRAGTPWALIPNIFSQVSRTNTSAVIGMGYTNDYGEVPSWMGYRERPYIIYNGKTKVAPIVRAFADDYQVSQWVGVPATAFVLITDLPPQ